MYRIRKLDEHNWVIEEFEPGGGKITRGRHVGKEKKERWKLVGYYSQLKFAAQRLIDYELSDDPRAADGWTGEDLQTAIEAAEERVMAAVDKALEQLESN